MKSGDKRQNEKRERETERDGERRSVGRHIKLLLWAKVTTTLSGLILDTLWGPEAPLKSHSISEGHYFTALMGEKSQKSSHVKQITQTAEGQGDQRVRVYKCYFENLGRGAESTRTRLETVIAAGWQIDVSTYPPASPLPPFSHSVVIYPE